MITETLKDKILSNIYLCYGKTHTILSYKRGHRIYTDYVEPDRRQPLCMLLVDLAEYYKDFHKYPTLKEYKKATYLKDNNKIIKTYRKLRITYNFFNKIFDIENIEEKDRIIFMKLI